ncbi:MAG: glycosyltransferase family 2 protein [Bacteroidota bacterium]|nr:glycosyltransferase family 2 protein [Bacteroidota bacterium]
MPIKISGVIITYNEEKNIGRCINSISAVVDEIVVVDSFSTDNTKEIALANGARFIEHIFEGHIEQKNFALAQSTFDYVLSMDADEALSAELKQEVLNIKENWVYDSYIMARLTNYCGKWIRHSGWYPDKKLRLFNRSKGQWGGTNPHDRVEMQIGATIGMLQGDLLHYSIYTIEEHVAQLNKFTSIGAAMAFKKGKKSNLFLILFSPLVKFIKAYFLQRGFLDGYYGFLICSISSFASFLKYVKLRQIWMDKGK